MAYTYASSEATLTIKKEETKQTGIVTPANLITDIGIDQTPSSLKLYGTTIVNLLGKYGNFEVDSDSDGLADGWVKESNSTASLISGVVGSYAQKLYFDNTGGTGTIGIYIQTSTAYPITAGEELFVKIYLREESENTETNDPLIEIRWYDSSQAYLSSSFINPITSTSWSIYYGKLTAPTSTAYFKIKISLNVQIGNIGSIAIDGLIPVNLTKMGALDSARASAYALTNWSDLLADDLSKEIPYIDSAACIGWDWPSGEKAISIENRGKNLIGTTWTDKSGSNYDLGTTDYFTKIGDTYIISAPYDYRGMVTDYIPVVPGKTYMISYQLDASITTELRIRLYDKNKVLMVDQINDSGGLSGWSYGAAKEFFKIFYSSTTEVQATVTIPANVEYIRIAIQLQSTVSPFQVSNIQFEEGSSATDYEPPHSDKIEIPSGYPLFGYAGIQNTLNLQSGTFEKKWDLKVIKGTDADWAVRDAGSVSTFIANDGSSWAYIVFHDSYIPNLATNETNVLCFNYNGILVSFVSVGLDSVAGSKENISTGAGDPGSLTFRIELGTSSIAGWPDTYTPTEDDWKRYLNGWKYVDGTSWEPIGYSGASVDATTALNNLVTDIYSSADWHPYVFWYQLATPESPTATLTSTGFQLYYSQNNILSDSDVPAALMVEYQGVSSTQTSLSYVTNFRAHQQVEKRIIQPYDRYYRLPLKTSETHKLGFDKWLIDDATIRDTIDQGFFRLEHSYLNENDGSTINEYYHHCQIDSHELVDDQGQLVAERVEISAAKREVV
ncbi:hypothetical protein [Kosmotoga pacifica]|uniref:Uncharacterized protein n=1 Tax=Kosmotoga pacifica TaxID=1330330 RepID=A0A0G2Z4P9_9BACT|nr:hypothetical protein [Kosmotoga pacifica]AKI96585.1 hypothetical protein IX53_00725 [Kosmotoga pacifica]